MIEVTHLYCPENEWGASEGEPYSTHHLIPRGSQMVCRNCGKTEKELRESAERAAKED